MLIKLTLHIVFYGSVWYLVAYFLCETLSSGTSIEIIKSVGNLSALAGALAGWSSTLISYSRSSVRDIDNPAAQDLYIELGDTQRTIIWRWAVVFVGSVSAITCATLAADRLQKELTAYWLIISSFVIVGVSVCFVLILFKNMLSLLKLRTQLDKYEHRQVILAKNREFLAETE